MSTPTNTADSVLDLNQAMNNMDGDVALLEEIIGIFMDTAPRQLENLEECLENGDLVAVAIQAHAMKGGASNFFASRFVAAAFKLELLSKSGIVEGSESLLAGMKEAMDELIEVVAVVNWAEVGKNWVRT